MLKILMLPLKKSEQCTELDDYESTEAHDASFHCSDLSNASDKEEATDKSVPHPAKERKFIHSWFIFLRSAVLLHVKNTGFIRCLEESEDKKFKVDLIATDCHPSIIKYMHQHRKKKHDFDLWTITK